MKLSEYLTNVHHPKDCLYLDLNADEGDKIKSEFWSNMVPYSWLVDKRVEDVSQPVYLDARSFKQLKAGELNVNIMPRIKQNEKELEIMFKSRGGVAFVIRHGERMNFRAAPTCDKPIRFYAPEPRIGPEETGGCFQYLPFGRDRYLKKAFISTHKADISDQKDTLVTAGFSCGNTPQRGKWADLIDNQPHLSIDRECMKLGHHNQSVLDHGSEGHALFASKLVRSKFTLCPPSTTIDTTRFWDALSVGSIPIVLSMVTAMKNITYGLGHINKFFKHVEDLYVPFLLVTPKIFRKLTDEDLESAWTDFNNADWNFDCLTSKYWLDDMASVMGPSLESRQDTYSNQTSF